MFERMLNSIYALPYNEATIIRASQWDVLTLSKKLVEQLNVGGFSVSHDVFFTKISIGARHVYIILAEDYRETIAALVMLGTAIGQIIDVDGFEWYALPDKDTELFCILKSPHDRIYSLVRDAVYCGKKVTLVSKVRPIRTVATELHAHLNRHGKNTFYEKFDDSYCVLRVGKSEDSFRVYIAGEEAALPSFESEPDFKVVYS